MFGIRRGLAALGAVSLIAVGGVATASAAFAWDVGATASADCSSKGTVVINGSFTNHEPNADGDMHVTMKLGSKSDGPTRVNHQEMQLFTIDTGESSVPAGSVTFLETWVNRSGSDQKTVAFSAKSCSQPQPESKKVFVCKYVGTPGVNERLQTGNNPISVSWKQGDRTPGQWFNDAQNRSYVLAWDTGQPEPDVSLCPAPEGPPPVTKVNVPASPATVDACNPQGVTDNVAWKNPLPADTDRVNWSESSNGNTRTASLKGENVEWSDGTKAPKVFTLPDDSGVMCVTPPTKIDNPTVSLEGVCDINNDVVTPSQSDDYTSGQPSWHDSKVSVTFTIKDGVNKVFSNGEKSITITVNEKNTDDCVAPTAPVCAHFSGFPEGSVYVIRATYKGGATVAVGPFDVGSNTSVDLATTDLVSYTITVYGPAPDYKELYASGSLTLPQTECLVIKPPVTPPPADTPITVPTVPVVDECGVGNAHYGEVPAGNYTVVRNEDGSITLTAKDGYVFPGNKVSVTLPKPVETNTEECPTNPPPTHKVTAVKGVFADKCGTTFNLTFTPAVTKGVTYVQGREGNTLTVHAVAQKGYELTNPNWTESRTDKLVACPVTVVHKPPTTTKPPVAQPPVANPPSRGIGASTGLDDATQPSGLGLGGILLAMSLLGLLVLEVTRRRTQPVPVENGRHRR